MVAQAGSRKSLGEMVAFETLVHLYRCLNRSTKTNLSFLEEEVKETNASKMVRILELESQSPFNFMFDADVSIFISAYLVRLINEQKSSLDRYIALPSAAHLALFFSVKESTAKEAFEKMRKAGHNVSFTTDDDDSPILTLP